MTKFPKHDLKGASEPLLRSPKGLVTTTSRPRVPPRHKRHKGPVHWLLERPIAHRGLHNLYDGVLEHSRTAIQRAIAADLPIEIDLVSSFDQVNFVIHDFVLDHLTNGAGDIRKMPADEVRQYKLNLSADEPVMTFEELLALVNCRVPLIVEIKSRDPHIIPSVREACSQLADYGGQFAVHSFNPLVMEWVSEAHPRFVKGLLAYDTDFLEYRNHYLVSLLRRRWEPDFIGQQMNAMNSWMFQHVLETGKPLLAFTVRDLSDWAEARSFASNIFFEYIEPDRGDWTRPSRTAWRSELGEKVDRRATHNPNPRPGRQLDMSVPWWRRK